MLLALDPATVVGWAVCEPGRTPEWGSCRMGPRGCGIGNATLALHQWLTLQIEHCRDITAICYEEPFIGLNPKTDKKLIGFAVIIEMVAVQRSLDCTCVTSQQAAKFLTGKGRWPGGRAEKKAAVVRACKRYGFDVGTDDNAADALAILLLAESILYPAEAASRRLVLS